MCHLGTLRLHFYLCHWGPWSLTSASFSILSLCYVKQVEHFLQLWHIPFSRKFIRAKNKSIITIGHHSLSQSNLMERRQCKCSDPWLLCRLQPNIMDVCFSSLQVNWKVAAAGGWLAGAGPLSAVRLGVPVLVCKYWLYAVLQPSIVHTATNMMIGVILQIQCVH